MVAGIQGDGIGVVDAPIELDRLAFVDSVGADVKGADEGFPLKFVGADIHAAVQGPRFAINIHTRIGDSRAGVEAGRILQQVVVAFAFEKRIASFIARAGV